MNRIHQRKSRAINAVSFKQIVIEFPGTLHAIFTSFASLSLQWRQELIFSGENTLDAEYISMMGFGAVVSL
jgi:hypothetical protein